MKEKYNDYLNQNYSFDKLTMAGIISLLIVIAGTFGFVYELIFYYFNDGIDRFNWQGGNFLPWINIYAIGAVIIYLLTYKHRKSWWKVFLISFISTGILEYISGLGIYIIGNGTRYWDYNTEILNFGNIQGFVCLRSVLFFGISGLILIYAIIPLCFFLAKKLDKKLFLTISFSLCFIVLFDEIYNLLIARLFSLPNAGTIYRKIGLKV